MTDALHHAAWDGRPKNPDDDGWHWLAPAIDPTLPPGAYRWHAPPRADVVGMWDGAYPKDMVRRGYTYLGPCLTPEEARTVTPAMLDAAMALDPLTFADWPGRAAELQRENMRRAIEAALKARADG